MPLLQLLGPLRDELFDLLVLAVECGGERRLTSGEVLLLGVQLGLVLVPGGLVPGSLFPRRLLGLLNIGLLQEELLLALGQLVLDSLQLFVAWRNQACVSATRSSRSTSALSATAILDLPLSRLAG